MNGSQGQKGKVRKRDLLTCSRNSLRSHVKRIRKKQWNQGKGKMKAINVNSQINRISSSIAGDRQQLYL